MALAWLTINHYYGVYTRIPMRFYMLHMNMRVSVLLDCNGCRMKLNVPNIAGAPLITIGQKKII